MTHFLVLSPRDGETAKQPGKLMARKDNCDCRHNMTNRPHVSFPSPPTHLPHCLPSRKKSMVGMGVGLFLSFYSFTPNDLARRRVLLKLKSSGGQCAKLLAFNL